MSETDAARVVGGRIAHAVRLLRVIDATAGRYGAGQGDDRVGAVLARLREMTADQEEALVARLHDLGARDGVTAADKLQARDRVEAVLGAHASGR